MSACRCLTQQPLPHEGHCCLTDGWNPAACYERLTEAVRRAQKAELAEYGHLCGHRFRISVVGATHSGIVGEGPESHRDGDYMPDALEIEVRAHNLADALTVAATVPLSYWLDGGE